MLSHLRSIVFVLALFLGANVEARVLRVCAASNNLPFSNEQHQGFENQIAELIASQLAAELQYVWVPPAGSLHEAVEANRCDVIPGIAGSHPAVVTTRPYYQSSYAFVTRRARRLGLRTLDDPRLKDLALGIHTPAHYQETTTWVERIGVHGLRADTRDTERMRRASQSSSPGALVDAVARGQLDAAVLWGPVAAHHLRQSNAPLDLASVLPTNETKAFAPIGVGIGLSKRSSWQLTDLQRALDMSRAEISAILDQHGVPRQTSHVSRIHNAQILRPPH